MIYGTVQCGKTLPNVVRDLRVDTGATDVGIS